MGSVGRMAATIGANAVAPGIGGALASAALNRQPGQGLLSPLAGAAAGYGINKGINALRDGGGTTQRKPDMLGGTNSFFTPEQQQMISPNQPTIPTQRPSIFNPTNAQGVQRFSTLNPLLSRQGPSPFGFMNNQNNFNRFRVSGGQGVFF